MPYFPQLNSTGLIAQRPYAITQETLTTLQDQPTGRRYAKAWRTNPLARWTLNNSHLTDAELVTLEAFFDQQAGRYGEWSYLDPGGNLVQYSGDFAQAAWVKSNVTVGAAQTDPFGGTRATALTGSVAGAYIDTALTPTAVNGFVMCASVWVKAPSGSPVASIGFDDGGNIFTEFTLTAGEWRRIHHPRTITSAGTIRVRIGIGATTLHVFGAQCVPMRGPGAYARSPQNYGYHAKCRFDMDSLGVRYLGPNQNAVAVSILEYA